MTKKVRFSVQNKEAFKDNRIITEVEDTHRDAEFDFEKFLEIQHAIAMKYESTDGMNFDFIGETEWTRKFDSYLLHAIEECAETYDEMRKWDPLTNRYPKDLVEELIDVVMYLGSLDLLLYSNIKDYDHTGLGWTLGVVRHSTLNLSRLENSFENVKLALLEIMSQVTMLRRVFPARKWHKHKPSDDKDLNDMKDELVRTRGKIVKIISNLVLICLVISEYNVDYVDGILVAKQNKVLGLK